jgi:hypothetical protein
MPEERRDHERGGGRRAPRLARLAVLLLLGAFFLLIGGSPADAAESAPVAAERPGLLAGTLDALDADPVLAPVSDVVGPVVADVVEPVVTATEPVVAPVLAPVVAPVRPVLEPAVPPLRPVVEQVVDPVAPLPGTPLVAPAAVRADADAVARPTHPVAAEGRTDVAAARAADTTERTVAGSPATGLPDAGTGAPAQGAPTPRPASTTGDGGTGTPVPYGVLVAAFAVVLLLAGGVVPRTSAPPLAPTFLPPVLPG